MCMGRRPWEEVESKYKARSVTMKTSSRPNAGGGGVDGVVIRHGSQAGFIWLYFILSGLGNA